jgi:cell division protein FtsL
MIRITTLLWIALLVIAGGTVMHVSYQVRQVEQHLSQLNRDTRQEQDKLRILSAEWDTLNDPHRIDELSKRYLTLEPTPIARVVSLDQLPMKLSDDQIAKLTVPAKTAKATAAKATAAAPATAAKKPEILIRAPAFRVVAQPVPVKAQKPADDGVGLILARMEKHE